jgi:hypothetical protein
VTHLRLFPAARVALLICLAASASSCNVFNGFRPVTDSVATEQVSTQAGQLLPEQDVVSAETNAANPSTLMKQKQLAQPVQATLPEPRPSQQSLIASSNALWLAIGAFAFGGAGTVLGILILRQANKTQGLLLKQHQEVQTSLSRIVAIGQSRYATNEQLQGLKDSIHQIMKQNEEAILRFKQPSEETIHPDQGSEFETRNQIRQTPSSSPPYQHYDMPIRTPQQILIELIAAVNRADRQSLKHEIRAQLNITSNSENEISKGRLMHTQLEPVSDGGSYLLAVIDDIAWLFPTEQTLQGFALLQPSKGIFKYSKEAIAAPKVLAPARLTAYGQYWQVEEMGTIAIPG